MEAELHINLHTTNLTCHTHMLYKNAMQGNIRQGPLNKWTEYFIQSHFLKSQLRGELGSTSQSDGAKITKK